MCRLIQSLRKARAGLRDRRGASAVEFAVALPVLVGILIPTTDLGMGFYTQMQVQDAAQAGAQYAVLHGWDSTAIQNAVTSATALSTITASPAPTQSCGCASGTSITTVGCNASCPDGSTPGSYVTVNAQAPYTTLIPYPGIASSFTVTAQSAVRIQ